METNAEPHRCFEGILLRALLGKPGRQFTRQVDPAARVILQQPCALDIPPEITTGHLSGTLDVVFEVELFRQGPGNDEVGPDLL